MPDFDPLLMIIDFKKLRLSSNNNFSFKISKKFKIDDIFFESKMLIDQFIVFNELTYPNLINFFKELKVPFEKSNMSFSVSVKNTNIEYSGNGFNGIFANKLNLFADDSKTCHIRFKNGVVRITKNIKNGVINISFYLTEMSREVLVVFFLIMKIKVGIKILNL